jgi:hypothetical protein
LERMHAPRRGQGRGSEPDKARRKVGGLSQADARIEEEVQRRTAELRGELDMQHRRLREMSHQVKNNFQTLSALTLLKARRTVDEGARRALLNMAERIGALSTAYRLTDPSSDERVDASALVAEIAAEIVAGFEGERVALAHDIEPVLVPVAVRPDAPAGSRSAPAVDATAPAWRSRATGAGRGRWGSRAIRSGARCARCSPVRSRPNSRLRKARRARARWCFCPPIERR